MTLKQTASTIGSKYVPNLIDAQQFMVLQLYRWQIYSQYVSRVVNYARRAFIILATDGRFTTTQLKWQLFTNFKTCFRDQFVLAFLFTGVSHI